MSRHRAFSFEDPFVARDRLEFAGRSYAAGDPFPWRELGLSERQVWNLWAARRIDNAPPATRTATADLDLDRLSPSQLAELEVATAPPATVNATPGAPAKRAARR